MDREAEQALGIDLPDDYGQIVVYDSEDLATLQQAPVHVRTAEVLLLLLIPILVAASLWASTRRRRTLIQLTVGAAVGLVIVRRIAINSKDRLYERVDTQRFPSVRVLTDDLMASLFRYTAKLLAIVLVTAAGRADHRPVPVGRDRAGLGAGRCSRRGGRLRRRAAARTPVGCAGSASIATP